MTSEEVNARLRELIDLSQVTVLRRIGTAAALTECRADCFLPDYVNSHDDIAAALKTLTEEQVDKYVTHVEDILEKAEYVQVREMLTVGPEVKARALLKAIEP